MRNMRTRVWHTHRAVLSIAVLMTAVIAPLAIATPAYAGQSSLETKVLHGSVGKYPVGASMVIRDHQQFVSGHYYYASQLKDIPLSGHIEAEQIVLTEPGGGTFRLHFVNPGQNSEQQLDFYNSLSLEGTWQRKKTNLPVILKFSSTYPGAHHRWYADVTNESDPAFEKRVQHFLKAVIAGDPTLAARYVSYPMRINTGPGKGSMLGSPTALLAQWQMIFTPTLVDRLRGAIPHEMFVRNGQAMIADGVVWFDANGAKVINVLQDE